MSLHPFEREHIKFNVYRLLNKFPTYNSEWKYRYIDEKNQLLHGEEYPIEYYDGSEMYIDENEKGHREKGPAIIQPNTGRQVYMKHGEYHNLEGPAIITPEFLEYYIDGVKLSEEEWDIKVKQLKWEILS